MLLPAFRRPSRQQRSRNRCHSQQRWQRRRAPHRRPRGKSGHRPAPASQTPARTASPSPSFALLQDRLERNDLPRPRGSARPLLQRGVLLAIIASSPPLGSRARATPARRGYSRAPCLAARQDQPSPPRAERDRGRIRSAAPSKRARRKRKQLLARHALDAEAGGRPRRAPARGRKDGPIA